MQGLKARLPSKAIARLPNKAIIQNRRRDKEFLGHGKAERVHHHQSSIIRNVNKFLLRGKK